MKRILVVGSSNTDMVIKTDRFPEPGETIIGGSFFMFAGGKGANQAVAAARLGGSVQLLASVGSDVFGANAIAGFEKDGIDVSLIQKEKDHASGVALITLNKEGENEIVVAPGANAQVSADYILKNKEAISSADIVLAQLETPLSAILELNNQCKKLGTRFILNPAPAQALPDDLFKGLFLITPNETEASILTGLSTDSENEVDAAANVLLEKGIENVIITMGGEGAYFKNRENSFLLPAPKVEVQDTTGAGDVFNGALAVALAEGRDWKDAIEFAIKAGSLAVTKMGAQSSAPTLEDMS